MQYEKYKSISSTGFCIWGNIWAIRIRGQFIILGNSETWAIRELPLPGKHVWRFGVGAVHEPPRYQHEPPITEEPPINISPKNVIIIL